MLLVPIYRLINRTVAQCERRLACSVLSIPSVGFDTKSTSTAIKVFCCLYFVSTQGSSRPKHHHQQVGPGDTALAVECVREALHTNHTYIYGVCRGGMDDQTYSIKVVVR